MKMNINFAGVKSAVKTGWLKAVDSIKRTFDLSERDFQLFMYIVIIILVNVAAATMSFRIDLTRNDTYSLSDHSKEVVSGLREDLKIRVFFSPNLPAEHNAIFRYLKDLLDEYDYYGNRHFSYEIVPEKDIEKQAGSFGINPVTSREFVDDQVKIRKTFMGIVIQHADLIDKLDSVTETEGLEYRLTSLMEKMSGKIDGLLKLEKPVSVRLYMDSALRNLPIDGIARVEETVRTAVARENERNYNKLVFETIDPSQNNSTDAIVSLYGLSKIRWGAGRSASGTAIKAGEGVFGLVVESGDRFKAVDMNLSPTLFGNYVVGGLDKIGDTVNNMVGSILTKSQKAGYVTARGTADYRDERSPEGSAAFKKLIGDTYDVVDVNLEEAIPDDIAVLIINGPREAFSDYQLYLIDQFLMKGRSALFCIDSYQEMQMNQMQGMYGQEPPVLPVTTGLDGLLNHYGVSVKKNIVLDEKCAKVNLGSAVRDYPLVPVIEKKGLSRDSVVTRYLSSAVFIKASEVALDLDRLKSAGLHGQTLVTSSAASWTMSGRISFNPFTMDAGEKGDMKSRSLAVAVSGRLESYFRGKEVPAPDKKDSDKKNAEKKNQGGMIQSVSRLDETVRSGESRIVVVGTSEIARSGFMMYAGKILSGSRREEGNSNNHLLHSMVDYLAGNYHVPEMKSKSLDYNPLDKTEDSTRTVLKSLNMGGVPFLVVIGGLAMWRYRRTRREKIRLMFSGEVKE